MEKIIFWLKVAAVVIVFVGAAWYGIKKFAKMTAAERKKKIIAWLLQAMIYAEQQFGGGTGRLKLSNVYAMFVEAFPVFAKSITFDKFSEYVDEVKPEMDHLLETNDAIAEIVVGIKEGQ